MVPEELAVDVHVSSMDQSCGKSSNRQLESSNPGWNALVYAPAGSVTAFAGSGAGWLGAHVVADPGHDVAEVIP